MARTSYSAPDPDTRRRSSQLSSGVPTSLRALPSSRSARKQTTSAPASRARDSSLSNDEGPSSSNNTRHRPVASTSATRRYPTRSSGAESEDNEEAAAGRRNDDEDEEDDDNEDTPPPASRRRSARDEANHSSASTVSTRQAPRKSIRVGSKTRKVLKAVSTAAFRRRRRTGFTASQNTGVTSEEEQDKDQLDLAPVGDGTGDSDSDNGDRIAGYNWKAQEVNIRASLVVNSLSYHRERRFEVPVDKRRNRKAGALSSASEGDHTDDDDPNFYFKGITFTRGQLVYFLPDPEWLDDRVGEDEPLTVEDLGTDDWWLGVILDCAELRYKDGTTACALRVAWCYSPAQAKELFAKDSTSRWAKELEEHDFWDNEMVASDHVDFVGAESTGGRYRGGLDQNAEELALEEDNQLAYDKAYASWERKCNKLPAKRKPTFIPPKPKTLPTRKEKICIRLMIRGLEQSDVERCTSSSKRPRGPRPKRWIEEVHEPTLDRFAEKWAVQLSHKARVKRFQIPSQTTRRTTAAQDLRTLKELQLEDLELRSSGYGGKGKGRGKSILPPNLRKPGMASKRKSSSRGHPYSTGGKKVRQQ